MYRQLLNFVFLIWRSGIWGYNWRGTGTGRVVNGEVVLYFKMGIIQACLLRRAIQTGRDWGTGGLESWSQHRSIQLNIYMGAALIAKLVKNPPAMQETPVWFLVRKIPWRRDRLPTPVFWPGEFHGLYSPWGHKESDMTEWLSHTHTNTHKSKDRFSRSFSHLWLFQMYFHTYGYTGNRMYSILQRRPHKLGFKEEKKI